MAINPAKIGGKSKYRQQIIEKHHLDHPDKCINFLREDTFGKPHSRSGWEYRFAQYCDKNLNVVLWGLEIVVIKYESRILMAEGKQQTSRRYYTDFYMEVKGQDGKVIKYVIEVKPKAETMPPVPPKRKTAKGMARYENAKKTYVTNQDKWNYATKWCKSKGMVFKIITEDELFQK